MSQIQPEIFGLQIDEERLGKANIENWESFLSKIIEFIEFRYQSDEPYDSEKRKKWILENKDWFDDHMDKENLITQFLSVESTIQDINMTLFCLQSLICVMNNVITYEEFVLLCRSSFSYDYSKLCKKRKQSIK